MAKPPRARKPAAASKAAPPLEGLAQEYASAILARRAIQDRLRGSLNRLAANLTPPLRVALAAESDAKAALLAAVSAQPGLFTDPKSYQVAGIGYGYRIGVDTVEVPDEERTVALIEALLSDDQQALLIRRPPPSVAKDAAAALPEPDRKRVGIRLIPGANAPFVRPVKDPADRLVAALLKECEPADGEAAA